MKGRTFHNAVMKEWSEDYDNRNRKFCAVCGSQMGVTYVDGDIKAKCGNCGSRKVKHG